MAELAVNGGPKVRTAPWPARQLFGEAEKAAAVAMFDECIANGSVISYNGASEQAYREQFAAFLGGGQAHTVNSGTSAVLSALAGLDLEPFTEVIVPPITDPGGVMPVALLNLIPVVADAQPGSYNVGPESVAAVMTERTSAVVLAHVCGEPVEMQPILKLCRERGVKVLEDCAQSHGATYHGELVGKFGDVAAFSTMSGKHHATGPQGGVVWSADEAIFWRARRFADRGKPFNTDETTNVAAGLNLNLNDLAAAIGQVQLGRLPEILAARQRSGEAVRARLAEIPGVAMGWQAPDSRSAYWFLRIHVDPAAFSCDMGTFVRSVSAEGLPCGWPYSSITSETVWFREQNVFGSSRLPWSAPQYGGPKEPVYPLTEAHRSRNEHFNCMFHERCGDQEVDDLVTALAKVAAAYRV